MKISIKGKIIEVEKMGNLGKVIGLMFKQRKNAKALLFEFDKPCCMGIHSFFVFFPFVAIWMNEERLIDIQQISPFKLTIKPNEKFTRLIEIPINKKYQEIVQVLVGKRKV